MTTHTDSRQDNLRKAEQLTDEWGMVLKDFPDELIEEVAETGNLNLLAEWMEANDD